MSDYEHFLKLKQERKQVEANAQLLANRIALLKQEESKTLKKAEDIRKQAQSIIENRKKQIESLKKKEEKRTTQEEKDRCKQEELKEKVQQIRQNRISSRQNLVRKAQEEASFTKEMKLANRATIKSNRELELRQKQQKKEAIKTQGIVAREKRQRALHEKKNSVREALMSRIQFEEEQRLSKLEEMRMLEQNQMRLIERFQDSRNSLSRSTYL